MVPFYTCHYNINVTMLNWAGFIHKFKVQAWSLIKYDVELSDRFRLLALIIIYEREAIQQNLVSNDLMRSVERR